MTGADQSGWTPLRRPAVGANVALSPTPFGRLALTHGLSLAGDALLTMALAGSLFFDVSPSAAKGRVALYLGLTMAPFAVVAPLLGPLLDRSLSGRRLLVVATTVGRGVLCFWMAGDIKSLTLYPEAFGFLVLSKSYAITKSALVPAAVSDEAELVEANSKLQLLGVAAGLVVAIPGIIVLKAVSAAWVLRMAAVVFGAASVAAMRLPRAQESAPPEEPSERAELRSAGIVLAASAMGVLRGIVGFLTFLVAFGFRRGHVPSWWFGVVLAASMAGTLLGAAAAPKLRQSVREERILLGSLAGIVIAGLIATRVHSVRVWTAIVAGAVGAAAAAGKLAFDSLVQRDAHDAARGRSFARFETRFQLLWVAGAFLPVVIPIPMRVGFFVLAAAAGFAAFAYYGGLRAAHRVAQRRTPTATT